MGTKYYRTRTRAVPTWYNRIGVQITIITILFFLLNISITFMNPDDVPIPFLVFCMISTLGYLMFIIFTVVHRIKYFKPISIKNQIKKSFIDTNELNVKRNDSSFEVPDIMVVYKRELKEYIVFVEQLPNMTTDVDKIAQIISSSLTGKNKRLVVKEAKMHRNQIVSIYVLYDINSLKRIVPKNLEELAPPNEHSLRLMKNINYNMAACPNILVAGMVGSGKSTFLYGLMLQAFQITSDIYIIDPKHEFSAFHFMKDSIASDVDKAIDILSAAVEELKRREKLIFQESYKRSKIGLVGYDIGLKAYIIVIDELASLLSLADISGNKNEKKSKKIMDLLLILIQKGRSSNINVWIATQQPNANVISTDIRSNMGLRILLSSSSPETKRMVFGDNASSVPSNVEKFTGYYEMLGSSNTPQFLKVFDLRNPHINNLKTFEAAYKIGQNTVPHTIP